MKKKNKKAASNHKKIIAIILIALGVIFLSGGIVINLIPKKELHVTPLPFDEIGTFGENLLPVRVSEKIGYVNKSGKLVIPTKYDMYLKDNYLEDCQEKFGKMVYYDKTTNAFGLIDIKDNVILPPNYEKIETLSKDSYLVTKDKLYYLLDENNKVKGGPFKEVIKSKNTKNLIVYNDLGATIITNTGKNLLNDTYYKSITRFEDITNKNSYYFINLNDEYQLYKEEKDTLKQTNYKTTTIDNIYFDSNLIYETNNNEEKVFDLSGKKVEKSNKYKLLENSNGNYSFYYENNKIGLYKNDTGKVTKAIYSPDYKAMFDKYAITTIKKGNTIKYGIINTKGKVVYPFTEETIITIINDKYPVVISKKHVEVKTMRQKTKRYYESFTVLDGNYYLIKRNGKYGIIDNKLKEIIDAEYDEIRYNDGYFYLKKNNQVSYATIKNN